MCDLQKVKQAQLHETLNKSFAVVFLSHCDRIKIYYDFIKWNICCSFLIESCFFITYIYLINTQRESRSNITVGCALKTLLIHIANPFISIRKNMFSTFIWVIRSLVIRFIYHVSEKTRAKVSAASYISIVLSVKPLHTFTSSHLTFESPPTKNLTKSNRNYNCFH